jgi:hypothetical protein
MGSTSSALIYLTFTALRNRTRVRLRRLRQPRYAIGAVGGLLYLYFMLFSQSSVWSSWLAGRGVWIGSVVLFLSTALVWVLPAPKSALAFTRAEVQFLFPAPLTRHQLLHYKLFGTLVAGFFSAVIFTAVFKPRSVAEAAMSFAGVWLVLATFSMHVLGLSLARGSLLRHGRSGLVRQRIPLLVVTAVVVALAVTIVPAWPRVTAMTNAHDVMDELQRLTSTGTAGAVFWPFRALFSVPLAASGWEFLRALPAVMTLLALNYVWVIRADTAFEEASAEQAEKVAEMLRTGLFRPAVRKTASTPFTLAGTGRPELAIVWKNLILIGRYASLKIVLIVLLVVTSSAAGVVFAMRGEAVVEVAAILCGMTLFIIVLMGPQFMRNDLRQDLARLAVLKTWPMRGAVLVRGEILAPACLLSAIAWLLIAAGAILADAPPADRVSYGIAAAMFAPGIIMAGLVLQNGFALLFPAWVNPRAAGVPGIDNMGQRLVLLYGGMLAVVVALLPPAIVAVGLWFGISYTTNARPVVVPAAAGAIVLVAECWLATLALGRMFDRMDVSALRPEEL